MQRQAEAELLDLPAEVIVNVTGHLSLPERWGTPGQNERPLKAGLCSAALPLAAAAFAAGSRAPSPSPPTTPT